MSPGTAVMPAPWLARASPGPVDGPEAREHGPSHVISTAGSLSPSSHDSHALSGSFAAAHWASIVDLPYPAGATTATTGTAPAASIVASIAHAQGDTGPGVGPLELRLAQPEREWDGLDAAQGPPPLRLRVPRHYDANLTRPPAVGINADTWVPGDPLPPFG